MGLTQVSTSGIKDATVATADIADDAVTFPKLQEIGSSVILGRIDSGDGNIQGLSAVNARTVLNVADGATNSPTITINTNADNRVITGSGTANTLNAESGVTIDGSGILAIQGTGQRQLTIGSTDGSIAALILDGNSNGDGAGGDYAIIRHTSSGDLDFFARDPSGAKNYIFRTGSSEQVRFQAGGGISFGGDTAAANALDDYEEGTWTPSITQGSINTSYAKYTKIGRLVTVGAYFNTWGNVTSSDPIAFNGLPYASASGCIAVGAAYTGYITNQGSIVSYIAEGSSQVKFMEHGSGDYDSVRYTDINTWGTGDSRQRLFFTITYTAA